MELFGETISLFFWSCLQGFLRRPSRPCSCPLILLRSLTKNFFNAYIFAFLLDMNTGWRWSIRPPVTLLKTSFESLRRTLRLASAGGITGSSGWTFLPVKDTWICRLTLLCSGASFQIYIRLFYCSNSSFSIKGVMNCFFYNVSKVFASKTS